MERLIRSAVKDTAAEESKKLAELVHHMQVQNKLLKHDNKGLRDALRVKEKHKKKSKVLNLQQREEYHSSAVFYSPRKIREARFQESVKQQLEHEEQLQQADAKALKQAAKLYKERVAEEKRMARKGAKVQKERERAAKAAERAAKAEANDTRKAIQQSQLGKRKASQATLSKHKRQRRIGGAAARAASLEAAPAAPPMINRRGRTINLPLKYK
jgi:hypothetical protein